MTTDQPRPMTAEPGIAPDGDRGPVTPRPPVENARAAVDPYLVDRHLAHVEAAVEDYRTVYPEPDALSANLALAAEGARLLAASRAVPSDQKAGGCACLGVEADPACPIHGIEWASRPGTGRTDLLPRPAVPSDHTATTEDADLRDRLQEVIAPVVAPYTSGPMDPLDLQVVDAVMGLLATARPDTTTDLVDTPAVREVQAQALEAAAEEGSSAWVGFKSSWGSNPTDVQTIDFAVWVGKWLRERAAAIREGADT